MFCARRCLPPKSIRATRFASANARARCVRSTHWHSCCALQATGMTLQEVDAMIKEFEVCAAHVTCSARHPSRCSASPPCPSFQALDNESGEALVNYTSIVRGLLSV
jgi:hypothetical protein